MTDRPPVASDAERAAVIAYLRQGEPVLAARGRAADLLDPARGKKVPMVYATDGIWIWGAAVDYYLEQHDLPPEPDFLTYLRAKKFRYTTPTAEQVTTAARAIEE